MRDDLERPRDVTAVDVDQTERLRAEAALAASEARWGALLAHAADITWTADPDGTITWATSSLASLGWDLADVVGRLAFDFVHPEDQGSFRDAWERVAGGLSTQETVECRLARKAQRWTWVRETITDLRSDPHVGSIVGNVVDVTERRAEESARKRQEERFRARFRNSRVPQSICDASGVFVEVNPALGRLLGLDERELLGTHVMSLSHPDDPGTAAPVLRAVLAGRQETGQTERVLRGANGEPVPVGIDLALLRDEHGRPDGAAALVHDLRELRDTERRRAEQEQFFAVLSARASDLALVTTADGTLVYASPAATHLLGYDPEAVVGHDGWGYTHPEDAPAARAAFERVVRDGGTTTFLLRVRNSQGGWRWFEETVTNLLETSVAGVVCNLRDVTEQVEAEEALRASEARYRAIVETAEEGIWAVTPEGRTLYANARMADMLGFPLAALYGKPVHDLFSAEVWAGMRERLGARRERGSERYELAYTHPDGTDRTFLISASPLPGPDGRVEGSLAMVSDVTAARRAEATLRHAAQHDSLTGLPNRALLAEQLEEALADAGTRTAVLFIDLDDFKHVNDTRGHEVGDELLLAVTDQLVRTARPVDTVGRFGGDEFIVIVRDTDEDDARRIAAGMLDAVAQPIALQGSVVNVTASIGLAVSPAPSAGELLRHADMAMYAAKSRRRRVEVFQPAMAEDFEHRVALAADLRAALDGDALEVAYQPVVDLASGRAVGFEALSRWTHPVHGVVEPATFVVLAEQSGLAPRLDRGVLRRALHDTARLRAGGRDLYVAVNLSARTLSEPGLDEHVTAAALEAGVPPGAVVLEVTESALMDDPTAAIAVLASLRDRGFQVAVDDFGTGYSSLAYLRDLPVTTLKVDRSFVTDLATQGDAVSIVAAILDLAAAVGLDVVAEGVQAPEQADLLRELGCGSAQGWLWSRALPLDELTDLLAAG